MVEGIELGDRIDLAVFEFIGRKDAELVAGAEECDGHHERAGELEGVVLGKSKIRHLKAPSSERANPARWLRQCPSPGAITAEAKPRAAAAC